MLYITSKTRIVLYTVGYYINCDMRCKEGQKEIGRVYTHREREEEQSRRDAEPAIRGNEASALEFSTESKHTHARTHTRRELTEVAL